MLRLFDAQLAGRPFFGPISLRETDPDDAALAAYRAPYAPALAAGARCFEFTQTALDRPGLPLWMVASVGADGALSDGFGYGLTLVAAQANACGETVEWHHAREWLARAPRVRGTFAELHGAGRPVLDPVSVCLSAGSAHSHEGTTLEWVEARRHLSGQPVFVPVEFVAPRFADLGSGFDHDASLAVPITNGLCAGTTFAHALAHGIMELLQRDGNSVHYRAMDRGRLVTLGEDFRLVQNPGTRELLRSLDRAGVEVMVETGRRQFRFDESLCRRLRPRPGAIAATHCGEAVHPDRERALAKALREFVPARARKAFNHGPLGPVRAVAPEGYLEAFGTGAMRSEDERALAGLQRWTRLGHAQFFEEIRHPLFDVRARVPFDSLPMVSVPDAGALLALLTERLAAAGLEILSVDFTPPGSPAVALKAIVPGLEVETMTYQRMARATCAGLGYVNYDDVPAVYRQADIFVSPTYSEGFSNTILVAMSAGLPVVSCAVVGVVDCLRDGVNGLLVPPGEVEALADALARMLEDQALRERLAERARQDVDEKYSWPVVARHAAGQHWTLSAALDRACKYRAEPHLP